MRDILDKVDAWTARGERVALATLVRVHGSAPRRAGARMAVTAAGSMAGSVSGGCVETAVVERARAVLAADAPTLASFGLADERELEIGLPCGSVDVLVEPLPDGADWQRLVAAVRERETAALAVALAPARLRGRRLVVRAAGERAGDRAVGSIDAAVDDVALAAARELLGRDTARVIEVRAGDEVVSVFVQGFARPERLVVIGATEIAAHLTRLAGAAGFAATVVDPRSAFADRDRFDADVELVGEWPDVALADFALLRDAYVVALSHDTKFDVPALVRALRAGAPYVGALGSVKTHERRCELLTEQGLEPAQIARIHAPVGLAIGARDPYEIAVAILAELIEARSERAS